MYESCISESTFEDEPPELERHQEVHSADYEYSGFLVQLCLQVLSLWTCDAGWGCEFQGHRYLQDLFTCDLFFVRVCLRQNYSETCASESTLTAADRSHWRLRSLSWEMCDSTKISCWQQVLAMPHADLLSSQNLLLGVLVLRGFWRWNQHCLSLKTLTICNIILNLKILRFRKQWLFLTITKHLLSC